MDEPTFTVRIIGEEPSCTVVFEPLGTEHELVSGDELLIHVFGRSDRVEDADVEVARGDRRITIWITPAQYRVWNKAGAELRNL